MANVGDFERRGYLEIIASVLNACHLGTRRTRVMGICGMSSKQLAWYIDVMLKANLLSVENDRRAPLFRISGKGKDFLKSYKSIIDMLE